MSEGPKGKKRKNARGKKTRKSGTRRRYNAFFDALPTERQHAISPLCLPGYPDSSGRRVATKRPSRSFSAVSKRLKS